MTSHDFNELTAISDKETYFHNCKEALTQVDQNPAMTYSIDNGFFVWKTLADEGIFIKLGSVKVEHADYVEIMKKILLVAINKSKQLQSEKAKWVLSKQRLSVFLIHVFLFLYCIYFFFL